MMRFVEGLGGGAPGVTDIAVALGLAVLFVVLLGLLASRLVQPGRGGQFGEKLALMLVALTAASSLYFFSGPVTKVSRHLPAMALGERAPVVANTPADPVAEAERRLAVAEMQSSPAVDAFLRDADYDAAEASLRLEITAAIRTGDDAARAWALVGLGQIKLAQGDLEAARSHLKLALSLFTEQDEIPGSARALTHLGMVAWARGETYDADNYFNRAMSMDAALEGRLGVREELKSLGMLNRNN